MEDTRSIIFFLVNVASVLVVNTAPPPRILFDHRGCCCRTGVPEACLDRCISQFPQIDLTALPSYCQLYSGLVQACSEADDFINRMVQCEPDDYPPAERPVSCPAATLHSAESPFCQRLAPCHSDYSCHRRRSTITDQSDKCCPTSCPGNGRNSGVVGCFPSMNRTLTQCERQREAVLNRLLLSNAAIPDEANFEAWMPQCINSSEVALAFDYDTFPSFLQQQCIEPSGVCWCVDTLTGEEMIHTRFRRLIDSANSTLSCHQLVNATHCARDVLVITHEHADIGSPEDVRRAALAGELYLPSCLDTATAATPTPSGPGTGSGAGSALRTHNHLQCNPPAGTCWCTLEDGRVALDTVRAEAQSVDLAMCRSYLPSRCDEAVAGVVHDIRQRLRATAFYRNASQFVFTRFLLELLYPETHIPRCSLGNGSELNASVSGIQFMRPFQLDRTEMFCVDEESGGELAGSRLAAGENRYLSYDDRRCPFQRTGCQDQVFRILNEPTRKSAVMNRETVDTFLPRCLTNSAVSDGFGFAPRQCGRLNASCWCVFADGQTVEGTEHGNGTALDCKQYRGLCQLPGQQLMRVSRAYTLNNVASSCPGNQRCVDGGRYHGIGLCQDQVQGTAGDCRLSGKQRITHGTMYFRRRDCAMCRCVDGQLNVQCRALPRCLATGIPASAATVPGVTASSCLAAMPSQSTGRVCTRTGLEYASAPMARVCGNFTGAQLTATPCSQVNACLSSPCDTGSTCVATPRQCLAEPCDQFVCVAKNFSCNNAGLSTESTVTSATAAFCGRDNITYNSQCEAYQAATRIACTGPCDPARVGMVCGADGKTYESRCQANTALVHVEHAGPCNRTRCTVTQTNMDSSPPVQQLGYCARTGQCEFTAHFPGGCCRFCGAGLLFDVDRRIAASLSELGYDIANDVISIVSHLQQRLEASVRSTCELRGHLNGHNQLELRLHLIDITANSSICHNGILSLSETIGAGEVAVQTAALVPTATALGATSRPTTAFSGAGRGCRDNLTTAAHLTLIVLLLREFLDLDNY